VTANNPPGALPSGTVTYQNPQSFQIISAGLDGYYGVGGQYQQAASSTTNTVPFDSTNTVNTTEASIRQRERDNLTNFKSGRLQ
jgi:hypothetical protein